MNEGCGAATYVDASAGDKRGRSATQRLTVPEGRAPQRFFLSFYTLSSKGDPELPGNAEPALAPPVGTTRNRFIIHFPFYTADGACLLTFLLSRQRWRLHRYNLNEVFDFSTARSRYSS